MDSDDLEPIDLEPIDLDLVDRESGGDGSAFERGTGTNRTRAWLIAGLIGLGLAAWAAVAASTHAHRPRPDATPVTATTTPTVPRIDRSLTAGATLQDGMTRLGVERFAAVIDDRLYTFDARHAGPTQIPLPEGHVVIAGQNGSSLLASTSDETLVFPELVATQTLGLRDTPIASIASNTWWRLRNDATIRLGDIGTPTAVPPGLRVVAEVPGGFLAQNAKNGWVIWASGRIEPIQTSGEFLTAGPRLVVFKDGCGYSGCTLHIYDVRRATSVSVRIPDIPEFATFSPDGKQLALESTQGNVAIVEPSNGTEIAAGSAIVFPSQSQGFTWSADSRELLVVRDHEIVALRDGRQFDVIERTDGVEQLAALP